MINGPSNAIAARGGFFYGYAIVLVAILAQIGSTPGQTYAISVFIPYLESGLELSKTKISAAYMLGTLLAAVPLTFIGPISDRWGIRKTTVGVSVALGIACCLASLATGFWSILAAFLFLRFLGQGAITLLAGNMVSMWFHRKLGAMNAIMCAGSASAFAFAPVLLRNLIDSTSWQTGFLVQGGLLIGLLVPIVLLLYRNHPRDLNLHYDGDPVITTNEVTPNDDATQDDTADEAARLDDQQPNSHTPKQKSVRAPIETPDVSLSLGQAIQHRSFWVLAAAMVSWAMFGTGVVFHCLSVFAEYGIAAKQAELLFPTFSGSMLAMQLIGGLLADRMPLNRLLSISFLMLAVGIGIVPMTTNGWMVHGFALFFGAGQGLAISVTATMWARYYGRQHLGKIRGAIWCMTVAGSGCGPLVLGAVQESTGSFQLGLWFFAGTLALMTPVCLLATPPNRILAGEAG